MKLRAFPENDYCEAIVSKGYFKGDVCGYLVRFRKRDSKWIHQYSRMHMSYKEWLEYTDHDIIINNKKLPTGKPEKRR